MKHPYKTLSLGVALVFLILFIFSFWHILIYEKKGVGLPSVDWLPKEATDISYYFSYRNNFYEFSISEEDFLKWVKEKGFENKGWQDLDGTWKQLTSKIVFRYNYFEEKDFYKVAGEVEILDGIFLERRGRNGGGYTVGYDRKTGRAYFHSSPR